MPNSQKDFEIGENGVREDLMVSPDVDNLFPKIWQMQSITPIVFTNEKPLGICTQCVSGGPKKSDTLFPQTHTIPHNFVLPNVITLKIPSDHHHPPNHKLLLLL